MMMKKKKKQQPHVNEVAIQVPPHGVNFGYFSTKVFFLEWEQKEDAVEAIKVEEGFLLHQ